MTWSGLGQGQGQGKKPCRFRFTALKNSFVLKSKNILISRLFSWKNPEKCKPLAVLQFHSEVIFSRVMIFEFFFLDGGGVNGNLVS